MDKPRRLDPLAERVLTLLSGKPEGVQIVLGGYLALQHYLDYRTSHDIDAWWSDRANPAAERVIREVMHTVAAEAGMAPRERRFGDTLSFELVQEGQPRFSFQIAVRSMSLEEPQPSAWPPLRIETLADNVGAKMNALVNRGAPRDFLDIHAVIDAGLFTAPRCWELWQAKNPGGSTEAARRNLLLHLAGLDSRRPLKSIDDPEARRVARPAMVQGRVRPRLIPMYIDGSVYPDLESPPRSLDSPEARADYVHRICSGWDHGVQPDAATFALFSGWKDIFDRFPIATSPAYHAVRLWFRWEPVLVPEGLHPPVARYVEYDRIECRGEDPCEHWI